MSSQSLEDVLKAARSPVELLRNSSIGPYVYPVIPAEYSNWRDEQHAWQRTCVLFTQSYHMSDLYIDGPDTIRLLTRLGINSFRNFGVDKAKQFIVCNDDGYVIGDVVLCCLSRNLCVLVGRPPTLNWVQYHAETGGYDVRLERDERIIARPAGSPLTRKVYRYQVQGPNAGALMEKLTAKPAPNLKFFEMGVFSIAGRLVHALRHGMAGQLGWELFGPWEDRDVVRSAIVEMGDEFGLRQAGGRCYSSNTLESGWIPSPLPAVYSGDRLKAYREWLPATSFEATASLGGSFVSDDIRDYYLTPWDLGYGDIVRFDHDFIGREALQEFSAAGPRRKKVTLVWNAADATRAIGTMLLPGDKAKYIDFPMAVYSTLPYDKVTQGGRTVGISTWSGYSANESAMLSLAMVDIACAEPGTEITLVWGEENGGTAKVTVERHVQMEIRATVAPAPFTRTAREAYRG
jgi:syringate O-demethylase